MDKTHKYYVAHDCDCGNEIAKLCAYVGPEKYPVITYNMLGQEDFVCSKCGITWSYGDFHGIDVNELFQDDEAED